MHPDYYEERGCGLQYLFDYWMNYWRIVMMLANGVVIWNRNCERDKYFRIIMINIIPFKILKKIINIQCLSHNARVKVKSKQIQNLYLNVYISIFNFHNIHIIIHTSIHQ